MLRSALVCFAILAGCAPDAAPEPREATVVEARGALRDRAGRAVAHDAHGERVCPYGSIGEHAIGDVARGPHGDLVGRSGIEAAWDDALRDGDVMLTLDMELMEIVDEAFGHHERGAVVIVDVRDGAVLALHSAPGFDRDALRAPSQAVIDQLVESEALVDRATSRAMPPGGTIKTLTVLSGLEAGMSADEPFVCDGTSPLRGRRPMHCFHPHGRLDMRGALVSSCDLYEDAIADRVGLDALSATARDFGFGAPTNVGLRFEALGDIPPSGPDPVERAMQVAVGDDAITVTPLQLAMAYAAIANGGTLWAPRLVSSTAVHGTVTEHPARVDHDVSARPEHLAFLRDTLTAVVTSDMLDEGRTLALPIAGKTGHGHRVGDDWNRPVATWFAGFAPADDPEIAIVVLFDGSHHWEAEHVAIDILEQWASR